ncbi:MAG TPA: replication initiation protein [Balneolaceae bacterium]|nr:replication initiation protein [Balneolaceae bacterium]
MQKDLPDSQVATQRNDLLHGQQSLSLVQKRIFALTIQQIKRDDDELKTYTIEIQDLVDAGTSRRIFSQIEQETDSLLRKILLKKEHIEGQEFPETSRWSLVINAKHRPGEGNLEIRLHPDIREMLLDLKEQGNFTPVPVAELLACRSTYGQRMYELLYSWRRTGRWETTVKDLRFSLGVEDKYSNFSDFRRFILEKAQKDLKKHTNMRFTWEAESRKKGRKITHLIFDFSFKPDQMDLAIEEPKKKSNFDIFDLRNRLKKWAKLESKKINKIMRFLENNSDDREDFKEQYHEIEINLQQGIDSNKNPINSLSGYAWSNIKPLIEN